MTPATRNKPSAVAIAAHGHMLGWAAVPDGGDQGHERRQADDEERDRLRGAERAGGSRERDRAAGDQEDVRERKPPKHELTPAPAAALRAAGSPLRLGAMASRIGNYGRRP